MSKLIQAILARPSVRTQMESSIAGISVMMLGSLGIASYLVINGVVTGWMLGLTIFSEVGLLSFQYSMLSTTYQSLRQYKLENNLYPKDYKLEMKMEEAKQIIKELNELMEVKQ